jgi:hypothetical protein
VFDALLAPLESVQLDAPSPWELVLVSSGSYPRLRTLDQPWNRHSADLVEASLRPWGPRAVHRFDATDERPFTLANLEAFLAGLDRSAGVPDAYVVYVISHAITEPRSDLLLVGGDAERSSAGALSGLVPLGDVYALLRGSLKSPLALLVDACVPEGSIEATREALGFVFDPRTGGLDYLGDAPVITSELGSLGAAMYAFGDRHAYLQGDDFLVLGAKPGVLAPARPDPREVLAEPVGPLAARLSRVATFAASEARGLADTLRLSVDWSRGGGELTPAGTVTWSDFDAFSARLWALEAEPGATPARKLYQHPYLASVDVVPGEQALVLSTFDGDVGVWEPGRGEAGWFAKDLDRPFVHGGYGHLFVHEAATGRWTRWRMKGARPSRPESLPTLSDVAAVTTGAVDPVVLVRGPQAPTLQRFAAGAWRVFGLVSRGEPIDVAHWNGKDVVSLDGHADLYAVEGKMMSPIEGCGFPLGALAEGTLDLFALSADGRFVCRFTDGPAERRSLAGVLPRPASAPGVVGFAVMRDGRLMVAAAGEVYEISLKDWGWW